MVRDGEKAAFMRDADAMYEELRLWRDQHPAASFDEIASQVTLRRRELMGGLLQKLALQEGDGKYAEVTCPDCGEKMNASGHRIRWVVHSEGETELERSYHHCPECGSGLFPLDLRLNLTCYSWTPGTIEQAISMGIEVASYKRAVAQFTKLTHVGLSKSSLQRLVGDYGGKLVDLQEAEAVATVQVPREEVEVIWREIPEPDSNCMNISIDGVMVHLLDEGWKEVKVATVSAVTHATETENGEWAMQLEKHSYRAGLWDAKKFSQHQWAESSDRGVEKAQYLSSVNDGAVWIWNIVRMSYGRCVEIIDFWHAAERLWTIARQHFGPETPEAAAWVAIQRRLLAESGLRQIMHNVRQLYPERHSLPENVSRAIAYLFHNRWRMRYRDFRQAGYPIGSGSVESACKALVQARLKQAGMRWSRNGAQAVLALRSCLLSDRWEHTTILLGLT